MQALINICSRFTYLTLNFDAFCLHKKFLVQNMVSRNLKIKYRRSFFGFFWTILNPLLMAALYYFVFKVILKVQQENYVPFILAGIFPWVFFSQTISEATDSIVAHYNLISKIPVPAQTFPFVVCGTNFITFLFSVPILFLAALIGGGGWSFNFLWVLPLMAVLFVITYFLGLLLSLALIYFRDLKHAINLVLQLWMYATPIFYSEQMIPEKYRFLLALNPVGKIFSGFHQALAEQTRPDSSVFIVGAAWVIVLGLLARYIYGALHKTIVERI